MMTTLRTAWAEMDLFEILADNASTWFPAWPIPWSYAPETLDWTYFMQFSGAKPVGHGLREMMRTSETESLTDADREKLAKLIYDLYKTKWTRLWDTTIADYDPIENYNMVETMDKDTTGSDDLTHGHVVTVAGTRQDNVFGYNDTSATGTPAGSSTTGGSDTHSGIDSRALEGTEDYTLTRSGNIGTLTTQRMLQEERTLWLWDYFRQIFSDIDSVLCLDIY